MKVQAEGVAKSPWSIHPEAILVREVLSPVKGAAVCVPAERARSLLFAWIVSLPDDAEITQSALRLRRTIAAASAPSNPLLPHLLGLLDEIVALGNFPYLSCRT
jgi:hypothetical protein